MIAHASTHPQARPHQARGHDARVRLGAARRHLRGAGRCHRHRDGRDGRRGRRHAVRFGAALRAGQRRAPRRHGAAAPAAGKLRAVQQGRPPADARPPAGARRPRATSAACRSTCVHDYSYDGAMRSHELSLQRFGLPRIDILLIHDADAWSHGPVEGPKRYREAMDGAYRALDKLRSEKVIKAIGIGVNDPVYAAKFLREGDFDCMLLAGRYTLLEQPALRGGAAAGGGEGRRRDARRRVQLRHPRHRADCGRQGTTTRPRRRRSWNACERSSAFALSTTYRCPRLPCTSPSADLRSRASCSVP